MKIGAVTIGQSPRNDIIPEIREVLDSEVEIVEKGALDGLSLNDINSYYSEPTNYTLVTRMNDGTEVKIPEKFIVPRIKNCISELEEKGVEIIILLCTGEFPELESQHILLKPGIIIKNIVKGMLERGRLGVIVPTPDQISAMEKKWERNNFNVISESVSPYTGTNTEIIETANKIKNANVDLIILDCIGFNRKTKAVFRHVTKKPVLLPRTIIGRIVKELVEGNYTY